MKIALYYHTIKYLKIRQVFWRIFYRFKKTRIAINKPKLLQRHVSQKWLSAIEKKSAFINEVTVTFLNKTQNIGVMSCWNEPSYEKLWLYNLHYFDDLNAEKACERTKWHAVLIERWIDENPIGQGNGWEPYPLSLRIVNWIKWTLSGNPLTATMQHSLVLQMRFLMKRIEWHLLGNHLLANAKALVFAGLFLEGSEANLWLNKGLSILATQLPEQILSDGAHFELSPMYHGIILEDMLDLVNLYHCFNQRIPIAWSAQISTMLYWLQTMTHPDGELSFFNDACFGIAPSLKALIHYANQLNIVMPSVIENGLQHLSASGYCRLQNDDVVLIADVAAVGPRYLPGHAHADTLSCEFSVKDQRIFVNSGTSTYENNALRHYQRGTAAHNTLVIDDKNSSEVWGAFRVARRANVFNIKTSVEDHVLSLTTSHNGYQRLKGQPIHTRTWKLLTNKLTIEDSISSNKSHDIKLYFYFHPSLVVTRLDDKHCLLSNAVGRIATISISEAFMIEKGFFYSAFNQQVANQHIVMHRENVADLQIITELKWN